jgi:hypothetical protein
MQAGAAAAVDGAAKKSHSGSMDRLPARRYTGDVALRREAA